MDEKLFDEDFMRKLDNVWLHFQSTVNHVYSGGRRSRAHGSTVEFSDYREYALGDDFRRIDWNAYARFERFFVKLFLDEKQLQVRVFLDTSRSMNWGTPNKGFAARRLSAAIVYLAVHALDRGALITLPGSDGSECGVLCPSVSGRTAFYKLLEALESLPFAGEAQLSRGIRAYRGIRKGDGVCFIISDLLGDCGYQDMLDYLLYQKQQIVLVHLLSPEEYEPDLAGRVRLTDCENGDYRDLDITPEALRYYKQALRDYQAEIGSFCSRRGVLYVPASSGDSFEVLIGKIGATV